MMFLIMSTAVMIDCPVIIAVTHLSALLDGSTVSVNVNIVITWLMMTVRNILRRVVVINIVDIAYTHLAAVDLVTNDVIVRITETAHKTVPGVDDIKFIVNLTPQLHLRTHCTTYSFVLCVMNVVIAIM